MTEFGWSILSIEPPNHRRDMFWITPENHIYSWDGDGWIRIKPPEKQAIPEGDLPHG